MKRLLLLTLGSVLLISCKNNESDTESPYAQELQKNKIISVDIHKQADKLKQESYQTFIYSEGDTTFLMQQYFMVFLKSGNSRSQDSTEAAKLQRQHLSHLSRMTEEGYASLLGPFEDDGDIRGIVVYNTRTLKEADSLANLDPMVRAGRLKVEVHPWWTAKGGKLN